MKKSVSLLLACWFLITAVIVTPGSPLLNKAEAVEGEPWAFDVFFLPAYPPFYDAVLGNIDDLHKICPGTTAFDLKLYNNIIKLPGHLINFLSIANDIDAGNNTDAAISGGLATAGVVLDILGTAGISEVTLVYKGFSSALNLTFVGALITTLQITHQSYRLARANEIGRKIESVYGSIEHDPRLKNTGRQLGQGDPIRIDPKSRDYVWQKILADPSWRELFKIYVVNQLGQNWPELSLWESFHSLTPEAKIIEEETRLKGHILALLRQVNNFGKAREQAVLAARKMRRLADAGNAGLSGPELKKVLDRVAEAIKELQRITWIVDERLPEKIAEYKKNLASKDTSAQDLLSTRTGIIPAEIKNLRNWARVVQALPTAGKYGQPREELLKKLKKHQDALVEIMGEISNDKIAELTRREAEAVAKSGDRKAGVEVGEGSYRFEYFTFERIKCPKYLEEYIEELRGSVETGDKKAGLEVIEAREEAYENLKEVAEAYQEQLKKLDEDYRDTVKPVREELQRKEQAVLDLHARASRITGPAAVSYFKQGTRLAGEIRALKEQIAWIGADRHRVWKLINLNSALDKNGCQEAISGILQYSEIHRKRFDKAEAILAEVSKQALDRAGGFRIPFKAPNIAGLAKLMSENPPDYPGGIPAGLLDVVAEISVDSSRYETFKARIDKSHKLLGDYSRKVAAKRIPPWEIASALAVAVPYLKYIKSGIPVAEIGRIVQSLQESRDLIQKNRGQARSSLQPQINSWLEQIATQQRLLKKTAAGLSSTPLSSGGVESWATRAEVHVRNVEEDVSYLSHLISRFFFATQDMKYLDADLVVAAFGSSAPQARRPLPVVRAKRLLDVCTRQKLAEADEYFDLGLMELISGDWAEILLDGKFLSLDTKELTKVLAGIKNLPEDSYQNFYAAIAKIEKQNENFGPLLARVLKDNASFAMWLKNAGDLAKIGAEIDRTLVEKRKKISDNVARVSRLRDEELVVIANSRRELQMIGTRDPMVQVKDLPKFQQRFEDRARRFQYAAPEAADFIDEVEAATERARQEMTDSADIRAGVERFLRNIEAIYRSRSSSKIAGLISADSPDLLEQFREGLARDWQVFNNPQLTMILEFISQNSVGDGFLEVDFSWRNDSTYKNGGRARREGSSRLLLQPTDSGWRIAEVSEDPFLGLGESDVALIEVLYHQPQDQDQDVPLDEEISIEFSVPMDEGSMEGAISIKPTVDFDVSVFDTTLSIMPEPNWEPETRYQVRLSEKVTAVSGQPLESSFVFSFETTGEGGGAFDSTISGRATLYPFEGIDFSSQQVLNCTPGDDVCDVFSWGGDSLHGTGGAEMIDMGSGNLDQFKTAPDSGYQESLGYTSYVGHVYFVRTRDDNYAKFKITGGVGPHKPTHIQYVYQPDGSRNF